MRNLARASLPLFLFVCSPAAAAEPAPPPTTKSWYGWQTLSTDIAAQAIGFALEKEPRSETAVVSILGGPPMRALFDASAGGAKDVEWFSLGGYVVMAPLVHLAHGRPLTALYSLGARALGPLGLGAAGLAFGFVLCALCGEGDGFSPGLVLGAMFGVLGMGAGYLGAVTLDAAVFSVEEQPREPSATTGVRLTPILRARRDGGFAGLGGTF